MINSISDSLLQLLTLIPFVVIARRGNGRLKTNFLILAVAIFTVTAVATDSLSSVSVFEGQRWNWLGKLVSLLIALIFIFSNKFFTPRQFGLNAKIETKNARPILLICAAYLLLRVILYLTVTKDAGTFHLETILFQSTLPGLEEEIIFRGILLTLLNQVFTNPKWTLARVPFGWAAIITSLLFGLTHGLSFDINFHIQFNIFAIFRASFDGLLFALLTEKTKSLVLSIFLHNILNLIGNH